MAVLRNHWLFAAFLGLGIVDRVLFMVAYPEAFGYPDSITYTHGAVDNYMSMWRPYGYSEFLKFFGVAHAPLIVLVQHLMILALCITAYAFLVRRGVRRWVAALAILPLLVSPIEITLEHYVLAETLFTVLMTVGLLLVLSLTRKSWATATVLRRTVAAAIAGGCLAAAWLTRTIGMPIFLLAGLYLVIRIKRVRLVPVIAFVAAIGLSAAGYMSAYQDQHGHPAVVESQGEFLYGRVMTIADCAKMDSTDVERLLCPIGQPKYPKPDSYIWFAESPAKLYFPVNTSSEMTANDKLMSAFAYKVIRNQPGDFARMVLRESLWHFIPSLRPAVHQYTCLFNTWRAPVVTNAGAGCSPGIIILPGAYSGEKYPPGKATTLTRTFASIGKWDTAAGPLAGLALVATFVLVVARRRRLGAEILDVLLLSLSGLGLIVGSIATSMYDPRYAIPAFPLIFVGAALATRSRRGVPGEGTASDRPVTETSVLDSSDSVPRKAAMAGELEVTVLLPCLNEAETLETCVRKALAHLAELGIEGEVLVSDNGSTDGSQGIASAAGARVVHAPQRGYGAALINGIANARGKYVIMADADDSYDLSNLGPFIEALRQGHDLVMGNRFRGGIAPGAMPPLHRYLGNPVLSWLGRTLFELEGVKDFHCGIRGFNRDRIRALQLCMPGMEFASEMVVRASNADYDIVEVPTTLKKDGRSRPPHLRTWRDGWRHLRFLLMFAPHRAVVRPGAVVFGVGLLATIILARGPLHLAGVTLDINVLVYACLAVIVGTQMLLVGGFAEIYGRVEGITRTARLHRWTRLLTFERCVVSGLVLILAGLAGAAVTVGLWGRTGFGNLNPSKSIRLVLWSSTALALGIMLMFSGLLASLMLVRGTSSALATAPSTAMDSTDDTLAREPEVIG